MSQLLPLLSLVTGRPACSCRLVDGFELGGLASRHCGVKVLLKVSFRGLTWQVLLLLAHLPPTWQLNLTSEIQVARLQFCVRTGLVLVTLRRVLVAKLSSSLKSRQSDALGLEVLHLLPLHLFLDLPSR